MSFMSFRHTFKRVLRRVAAPLLMLTLMAVGQAAADLLRSGELFLNFYGHGAVLVIAPVGELAIFERCSSITDADVTPLLHEFPSITADHSRPTVADPTSWKGIRIRVTGSGAGALSH